MASAGLILAFHGCDEEVGERILSGTEEVLASSNDYDWLGAGAYFWEASAQRAAEWAKLIARHPQHFGHRIRRPFVLGAIIDPGHCLDLTQAEALAELGRSYELMSSLADNAGIDLPQNLPGFSGDLDLVKRHLDCAVVNFAHSLRAEEKLPAYDTVRGAFPEGQPLYPGSRIMRHTHMQICVREPARSIRGYFRPR